MGSIFDRERTVACPQCRARQGQPCRKTPGYHPRRQLVLSLFAAKVSPVPLIDWPVIPHYAE